FSSNLTMSRSLTATHHCDDFEEDLKEILRASLIATYKKNDIESAKRGDCFSRACRACASEAPYERSISIACGHAFCRE
ncbi:hypothetical protein PENTCL1PPCAC_21638, partial [Pristionchus entomophagus]